MKVVVSHVYSNDNAGDAALLSVLLGDVRSLFPEADITVLTLGTTRPGGTFDGCPLRPSLMFHAHRRFSRRPAKLVYALVMMVATLLRACGVAVLGRRLPLGSELSAVMRLYEEADLVVPVGGGYLRGVRGVVSNVNLLLLLHPLLLGLILGRPTVLYSQSVGPFGNRFQRWVTAAVLRRMDRVVLREDISVRLLEAAGVTANVVRSVDSGFLFDPVSTVDVRARFAVPPGRLLVGITVRQWLDGDGQQRYEQAVAELADDIIERHRATVVFVPQVTSEEHGDDDRRAGLRVATRMAHEPVVVTEKFDHRAVRGLYRGLDLLVGTRFHSVIFALTAGVPALAIEYEHKTSGIMQDLGLQEWVHDIGDVTGHALVESFGQLLARREEYRRQLDVRLPAYLDEARRTKSVLLEVVRERGLRVRADATPSLSGRVS